MPFIEADLGQDYEQEAVPEGRYDLRITDARDGRNKKDTADLTMVMIKIEDKEYPQAATVFHYLNYASESDTEQSRQMKMMMLTRFLVLFGVKFEKDGFNSEDLPGCTAKEVLLKKERLDGRDDDSNSLVLPAVEK